jgi:hypothetical protein
MSAEQSTGKCYRLYGGKGQGIVLYTKKTYCIDHSHPIINILGIWESAEDCLKLYGGNVKQNRVGGEVGFTMGATCWEVLAQIHNMEQVEQKRRWYFKRHEPFFTAQNTVVE